MDMQRIMTDDASPVLTCMATGCSFNSSEVCHAGAITVGEDHPQCDMYTHSAVPMADEMSSVSKCSVSNCFFNESMGCHAVGITLGNHGDHADCFTSRVDV